MSRYVGARSSFRIDGKMNLRKEDVAAAGAIISVLSGTRSPEAATAVAVWDSIKNDVGDFLAACSSGRKLRERGFEDDLKLASEVNVSRSVPRFFHGPHGYFRESW